MIVIITVFSLAYILHKTGVINRFITACSTPDDTPAADPIQEPQQELYQEPGPDPFHNISRLELEALAAAWMQQHKIKHWYFISRTAPNEALIEIITEAERAAK